MEEFESYRRAVMAASAGDVQVIECRRAFFAGAQALRGLIVTTIWSDDETLTKTEADTFKKIEQELDAFAVDVLNGRR